jgi:hypothetical protein
MIVFDEQALMHLVEYLIANGREEEQKILEKFSEGWISRTEVHYRWCFLSDTRMYCVFDNGDVEESLRVH